jgi:predicted nuclease of predicted toxin-antitoxin system
MKLLLDANISWRLCSFFTEYFGECTHINKTDLSHPAKDFEIWQFAKEHGYTIITQDSDFLNFLETKGYPPKLILLKTGNINREQMKLILLQARLSIIELHNNEEYGLLEIR